MSSGPWKRVSNSVEPYKKHSAVSQTVNRMTEFPSFNPQISLNSSVLRGSVTNNNIGKYLTFRPYTKFSLNETTPHERYASLTALNCSIVSSGDEPKIIQNQ